MQQSTVLKRLTKWFDDAAPCPAIADARAAIKQAEEERGLLDPLTLRQRQDWSALGGQVVGHEDSAIFNL